MFKKMYSFINWLIDFYIFAFFILSESKKDVLAF